MAADALSRRHSLLGVKSSRLLGFEFVKEYYKEDEKFKGVLKECSKGSHGAYMMQGDVQGVISRCATYQKSRDLFTKTLWELLGTKLCFSTSRHPQTDGQTEITHCTLGTLLRGLVSKSTKDWDVKLSYAEFAYNRSPTYATRCSPFEVVYGVNPRVPIDLFPFPNDEVYHVDEGGTPGLHKNKLMPHSDGPFKIVEKINDNAFKLALPGDYQGVAWSRRVHGILRVLILLGLKLSLLLSELYWY
ncbi:uncharacterized protein LOC130590800 [Beta vulgaris subsp. vulgaris]|uniref:uncharacterized protein LOC130590800 n=1 Tax=Beta vulgaris subsp. vulgaris TaxID=3555 RepID=UPI0025486A0D|nr:uncharacterized protein LOC130590800 [Beta vulgaris subsp. vulgaris]